MQVPVYFYAVACYNNKKGGGNVRKLLFFLLMPALILCALFCSCEAEEEHITPATVDVLKIGKADCIVINTGNNVVVIDTGEEEDFESIRSFMTEKNYSKIDALILTHYDKDHIGGAKSVIEEYDVGLVIESSASSNRDEFHSYHLALSQMGKEAKRLTQDYSFDFDDCKFKISVPKQKKYERKNDNNLSLVISMECGDTKFLFCGDAMEERIVEIIDTFPGEYDLIKLPYHGKYIENYEDFLASAQTRNGVITCSDKNPSDERTIELLERNGVSVYETKNGSITVYTNGKQITIKQ